MNPVDFLEECKKGLNIPIESTSFDPILNQKIVAVKTFMMGAGVTEEMLLSASSIGAVVVGVTDLWELKAGEIKFSPVFFMLVNQLCG